MSLFKQLSLNVEIDRAALIEQESLQLQAKGKNKEEADKLAEGFTLTALDYLVQDGILTDNGKSLKLNVALEKDGLSFNGQIIPEDQLGMLILGLMMNGYFR